VAVVRATLVPRLRCPSCHGSSTLTVDVAREDEREIREGALRCSACGATAAVERGVAHLLRDAPEHVAREAAGLERFAELMRADGWDRERILRLPDLEDGYWYTQATSFRHLLSQVELPDGARILDVGSNTCWASAALAERGHEVIALDIALTEMQGLHTADWWFEDRGVLFDRILGSMTDIPLADGSLDAVLCCEVLHHNDADELPRALSEIARVLKPGGQLLAINETLRTVRDRVGNHAAETGADAFDGYEHAYYAWEYLGHAQDAGLAVRVLEPAYRPFFGERGFTIPPGSSSKGALKMALRYVAQRRRELRSVALAWTSTVTPRSSLGFVGTKGEPPSAVGRAAATARRTLAAGARRR